MHPLSEFYSDIHATYDRVNRLFTFGRDRSWRLLAVREALETAPRELLDVCTGTGDFILEAARQSPGNRDIRLTGFDFNASMLGEAEKKLQGLQQSGQYPMVRFVEGAVGSMPFKEESFDALGITFGLRNLIFENPLAGKHLSELNRVLRTGGRLVVLESSRPGNLFWRFFNGFYLRVILPFLGGIVSGNLKAYRYLARSSRKYYTLDEMRILLNNAGFGILKGYSLFLGSVMLLVAEKKQMYDDDTGRDQ